MIERRKHLRLAFEPGKTFGIGRNDVGQDFHGDVTMQLRVTRLVDLAHAASPDGRQDLVSAETSPGSERHASGVSL